MIVEPMFPIPHSVVDQLQDGLKKPEVSVRLQDLKKTVHHVAEAKREEPIEQVSEESENETVELEKPSSLQELESLDVLHISRRLRVKGVMFLRGKKNRFLVTNSDNSLIYTVEEHNSWWVGYFCYGLRPLELRVLNNQGVEVMRIFRPYNFTLRVIPCSLQRLQVYAPPGNLIGSVQQQWTAIKPKYIARNANGDPVFTISGPAWTMSCFREVNFSIERVNGQRVGSTFKHWEGLVHALFKAAVNERFGLAFDMDLNVEEKALLMAVSLLLDYMYYDI